MKQFQIFRRIHFSILALLFCSTALFVGCTQSESKKVLNLYCWSNYFAPEVLSQFEQKTGVKVSLNYFSSNEELLAKLQAGARGYDLIVPTSYMLKALKELKLIQPLAKAAGKPELDWPELKSLIARFQNPHFDPQHEYSIPYAWGTTGIAVNRAKIKTPVDSLAFLFERAADMPALRGQISMLDDAPSVVGAALKYLGYSYNEGSSEAFAKVKALLLKQKKFLKAYTPESQPVLESGEVTLAQAYSGDVMQVMKRKNKNIEFVFPKEGGEIFVDNLAIPTGARSPELALEFIRFTLQQDVSLLQTQHLFFSPVVEWSKASDLKSISAIFPSETTLKNFEFMNDDPNRIEQIQKLWTELKSI